MLNGMAFNQRLAPEGRPGRNSSVSAVLAAVSIVIGAAATAFGAERGLDLVSAGVGASPGSAASISAAETPWGKGAQLSFELKAGGWANVSVPLGGSGSPDAPITFLFRVDRACNLETKFVYADGATFGCRAPVEPDGEKWQRMTAFPHDASYWWGGRAKRGRLVSFDLAVAGATGNGTLWIARMERGAQRLPSSFGPPDARRAAPAADDVPLFRAPHDGPLLDPARNMAGFGMRQRRAETMIPEDPLILAWLKQVQDTGSREQQLLPSTLTTDEAHTFNNALVAMAFIRCDERERAERILDFFQRAALDRDNADPTLQSFYLRGEPRGFYQRVSLRGENGAVAYHAPADADRWMGDMAWLLLAYCDYQHTYHDDRYANIMAQLKDLLKSWYIRNPTGPGGYVQHGWRHGDERLHENYGHHEGNIDCYAVFTLLGEQELAQSIRTWLEDQLAGRNDLPLDLYTWRVMAYDGTPADLLDIPDFDLRYRKTVKLRGREIVGPYHGPVADAENIWFDGLGHLSCAYSATGNLPRANFYANQLDAAIIEQTINGKTTHAIPYAALSTGDYRWVNTNEGFISVAAWYIFAKHRFNPLLVDLAKSATSVPKR